jgi:subtilisin family serine protease
VLVAIGAIAGSARPSPAGATGAAPRPARAGAAPAALLLELGRGTDGATLRTLRAAGGVLVEHDLHVWRVPRTRAPALLGLLGRERVLLRVELDRTLQPLSAAPPSTTPRASEWWLRAIGAAKLAPPGPGKPVTVIDTGIDVGNPEFAGKGNITLLNAQRGINLAGDQHGTAISSLIAAKGVHLVGVYPRAVLREWDATRFGQLSLSAIIAGLDAAIRAGPGVINLSLGGPIDDPLLHAAVLDAVRRGSLVVAAQGEDRFDGSPPAYPADDPHVLAVVATDRHNVVFLDSNGSESNDLSAPGVGVEAAVPSSASPSGYENVTGNSYAAAIVSAAAAWIWTLRPSLDPQQLAALLIDTASRIQNGDYNTVSGYGLLNLGAALTAPAPPADPYEPNDDIAMVRPGGLFATGEPLLTGPARHHAFLRGQLFLNENPRDVYRVWIPAHGGLTATVTPAGGRVALDVWDVGTRSVLEGGASRRRDLLAGGAGAGTDRLHVGNDGARGTFAYVEVSIGDSQTASYSLTLSTSRPS